jgi:hypothetical protein
MVYTLIYKGNYFFENRKVFQKKAQIQVSNATAL